MNAIPNPTVTLVEAELGDVVEGLRSHLEQVVWVAFSSTWAGMPYTYRPSTGKVSWVPSGDVTPGSWAAAIVQAPATATVRNLPLRTALGID